MDELIKEYRESIQALRAENDRKDKLIEQAKEILTGLYSELQELKQ